MDKWWVGRRGLQPDDLGICVRMLVTGVFSISSSDWAAFSWLCMYMNRNFVIFNHFVTLLEYGEILLGRAWASPTLAWLHCACACVCLLASLLGPTTYCKFQIRTFKYFMKIDIVHEACEGQWRPDSLSECSVGNPELRRLKFKHTWQLILICASTDDGRPVHRGYKTYMDGGWLPGRSLHG